MKSVSEKANKTASDIVAEFAAGIQQRDQLDAEMTLQGVIARSLDEWDRLGDIQDEIHEWAIRNFGPPVPHHPVLGVMEEAGELAHAVLKQEQGIRGSREELEAKAKDAVGDLLVYLCNLCSIRGWKMSTILEETWGEVKKRDWQKNKLNGRTA